MDRERRRDVGLTVVTVVVLVALFVVTVWLVSEAAGGAVPSRPTADGLAARMRELAGSSTDVADAAESGNLLALSKACEDLKRDARAVRSYGRPRPVPKTAWRYVVSATRHFERSAVACIRGADGFDIPSLRIAAEEVDRATRDLQTANALIS